MNRTSLGAAVALVLLNTSLAAQTVPEIPFTSNATFLQTPNDVYVGEVAGVGANSRGQIFVYTRTGHPYATLGDNRTFSHGGSRLFVFDANGKFLREWGQDVYGFNAAIGLRVDRQDNVWTIDVAANQVVKFDPQGRITLVLGRKPEAIAVRPRAGGAGPVVAGAAGAATGGARAGGAAGAGAGAGSGAVAAGAGAGRGGVVAAGAGTGAAAGGGPPAAAGAGRAGRAAGAGTPGSTFSRPTDVAFDRAGNIYVADGIGNNDRIAKFDKDGRFLLQWGSTGSGDGQFTGVKSIALDAQDNVYVADVGNKRIQVFDSEGRFKTSFGEIGLPLTLCITGGATQFLYVSHAGDDAGMDDAAIYKVQLDGKVVGKFGSAGKLPKEFGLANSIDCRNSNELLVGEMTNWRVQKVMLR